LIQEKFQTLPLLIFLFLFVLVKEVSLGEVVLNFLRVKEGFWIYSKLCLLFLLFDLVGNRESLETNRLKTLLNQRKIFRADFLFELWFLDFPLLLDDYLVTIIAEKWLGATQQLVEDTADWPNVWFFGLKPSSQLLWWTIGRCTTLRVRAKPVLIHTFWHAQIEELDLVRAFILDKIEVCQKLCCTFRIKRSTTAQAIEFYTDVSRLQIAMYNLLLTQIVLRLKEMIKYFPCLFLGEDSTFINKLSIVNELLKVGIAIL
jgi:hypothetical protein